MELEIILVFHFNPFNPINFSFGDMDAVIASPKSEIPKAEIRRGRSPEKAIFARCFFFQIVFKKLFPSGMF